MATKTEEQKSSRLNVFLWSMGTVLVVKHTSAINQHFCYHSAKTV